MTKPDKRQMKSASRLYAVQALFQMEASGQTVQTITREFVTHRFGATYDEGEFVEGNIDHFREVVEKAVNWQAKIAATIGVIIIAMISFKDNLPEAYRLPLDSKMTVVLGTLSIVGTGFVLSKIFKK